MQMFSKGNFPSNIHSRNEIYKRTTRQRYRLKQKYNKCLSINTECTMGERKRESYKYVLRANKVRPFSSDLFCFFWNFWAIFMYRIHWRTFILFLFQSMPFIHVWFCIVKTKRNWIGNQQWEKHSRRVKVRGIQLDLHFEWVNEQCAIDDDDVVASQHKPSYPMQQLFTTTYASL